MAKAKTNGVVEKKLVGVAETVISAADKSKDPTLFIPVRSLANVNFNEKRGLIELGRRKQERTFFNVGMAKKFMQTVLVADALAELQRADLTTSLREIYYRTKHTMKGSHENTFDNQNESDPLIEDLEVSLAALREELHVRAENAGQRGGAARAQRRRRHGELRPAGQGRLFGPAPSWSPSTSRSGAARPTSCCWSRRARSGTGCPRTSSGAATTACC
jgi:DNA topoisomerase VI subunit A